jgi:predicted enzyme related to lactoylglutathione lyase
MAVRSFYEIILYVEDMAAMVAFYRDVMGFPVKYPADADDFAHAYWVEFAVGEGAQLVLHGGGSKQLGKDAPTMGFRVDDVPSMRNLLNGRGVQLGEIRYPVPGSVVSDGRDPEGNKFSIFTRERA